MRDSRVLALAAASVLALAAVAVALAQDGLLAETSGYLTRLIGRPATGLVEGLRGGK